MLLDPVVQSIISLTSSLRDQIVKSLYFITKYTEMFVENMREVFAMQKLHNFFNKNIGIFEKLTSENLTKR